MISTEAATSSSPLMENYQANSLIWAKMKGFPPWPAKVLPQSADTPQGRIPVMFFGTKENAFMKASDCSDYMANKHLHEIPRKHKGFNEGVHEIRVEAGIEAPSYRDPVFFPDFNRPRRESARFTDAYLSGLSRKRSDSGSTKTRSRASSATQSTLKFLHKTLTKRRRLDSESSNGSKRRQMISGGLANDSLNGLFDITDNSWNIHDHDNFSLNPLNDDARSTRSRRSRGTSKFLDEFNLDSPARGRNRSGSHSEGKRSRLISGVSDILDEFLANGDFTAVAADLLNTLDEMPSESSEIFPPLMGRDGTPEAPAPLPALPEFCDKCGSECKPYRNRWICSNGKCCNARLADWDDLVANQPSTSGLSRNHSVELNTIPKEELIDEDLKVSKREGSVVTNQPIMMVQQEIPPKRERGKLKLKKEEKKTREKHMPKTKEKKKVLPMSPRQFSISPPTSPRIKSPIKDDDETRRKGRPKQYKVEKTPPVSKNGLRHCSHCNGQVRPQMCGGNKHRWRCVDKKCRKWYGWVKTGDEIPTDLGRKGRYNSVLGKIKLKKKDKPRARQVTEKSEIGSISSAGETARAVATLDTASLLSGETGRSRSPIHRVAYITLADMKKKQAAESLMKMRDSKDLRKTPTKKRLKKKEAPKIEEEERRPISPLSQSQMRYRPCGMEKRARWWLSEKRRADPSPERGIEGGPADAAAAFRILSHAFRAAAVTRADEIGTVNGSLDLMMDSLLGCMGPLLSLLSRLPNTRPNPEIVKQLWDSSAIHMPMFQ